MDDMKAPSLAQEVDAWWGSYSIRGIGFELLVSVLASVLVAVPAYILLGHVWVPTVLVLLMGAWLVQVSRWGYRIFGWNYRLTTRRLIKATGLYRRRLEEVGLEKVERAVVQRGPLDAILSVGRVLVETHGSPAGGSSGRALAGPGCGKDSGSDASGPRGAHER